MSKFHKTAIGRKNFSTPVQFLLKRDMLKKDAEILDFGCGRGFDVEHLAHEGFDIQGFDPNGVYNDWTLLNRKYDMIMCNFVLNVIEDIEERNHVVTEIERLLEDGGTAFLSVRNDRNVANGTTSTGTWQGLVEPTTQDWQLVARNGKFTMWQLTK